MHTKPKTKVETIYDDELSEKESLDSTLTPERPFNLRVNLLTDLQKLIAKKALLPFDHPQNPLLEAEAKWS